jgi:hypothetical protein
LASALAVALRLVGIYLAHTLEQILGIGLGNVGRLRPAAITLLRAPRSRADGSLRPVRHIPSIEGHRQKSKIGAMMNCQQLRQKSGAMLASDKRT